MSKEIVCYVAYDACCSETIARAKTLPRLLKKLLDENYDSKDEMAENIGLTPSDDEPLCILEVGEDDEDNEGDNVDKNVLQTAFNALK